METSAGEGLDHSWRKLGWFPSLSKTIAEQRRLSQTSCCFTMDRLLQIKKKKSMEISAENYFPLRREREEKRERREGEERERSFGGASPKTAFPYSSGEKRKSRFRFCRLPATNGHEAAKVPRAETAEEGKWRRDIVVGWCGCQRADL